MDESEPPKLPDEPVGFDEAKLQELISKGVEDFDSWISLIAEIEKISPDDKEKICLVYDSFLSQFPLCYGYWKKYAGHMARLCTTDKVLEVYERAVQSATYVVDLWVDYCSFGMLLFEDPVDVRRLFEKAMSFVGKDYLCHLLWDKYIEFEYSQKQWSSLAYIYIQSLRFPSKKLHRYYDSFKKLGAILEEEIECQSISVTKEQSKVVRSYEIRDLPAYQEEEILGVIKDLLDPAVGRHRSDALQKYLSAGEQFYQKSSQMDAKIRCFESHIRRPYFHVKPLDVNQLENWHWYLDFVEMQGDFDWTVKLYERCLIPCANYPEFWMRYVELMETKGGREIANLALVRATNVFLKKVPAIHVFCARFKEQIRDVFGARAAFLQCDPELGSNFIDNVTREANMEKRLGNFGAASSVYEKALEMAKEKQNSHTLSILYAHFSRFKYMITGSIDAAREVLIKGIQHLPHSKLLLERLINFEMMHRGPREMNIIDSIVADAISAESDVSQGLSTKDREDISSLYLEFVDLCGTIHDIRKAWNRHRKLFPYLLRHTASCKPTARGNYTLKKDMEGRQDMPVAMPSHASGDDNSHGSIHHSMLDQQISLPENPEIQSGGAVNNQPHSEDTNNGTTERMQQVISLEVLEEQSGQGATKQNVCVYAIVHEDANDPQAPQSLLEHPKGDNEIQKEPNCESKIDLRPPSLENLSLNPPDVETQESAPTTSHDCEASQGTPGSNGSRPQNGDDTNHISVSSLTGTRSDDPALEQVQMGHGPLYAASDPSSLQTHIYSQPLVPTNSSFDNIAGSGGNWHQMNYNGQASGEDRSGLHGHPPAQLHQQWQVSPHPHHQPAEMHSQILMNQGYPCQPPSWENPQVQQNQQTSQVPIQYQVSAAQVYPAGTHIWPAQHIQQQSFASIPQSQPVSQPVSLPQAHIYPYPLQSNEQYGYMQTNQTYAPHMWHYYYQQQQQQQQQQQPQQQPHQHQQQQPPQHPQQMTQLQIQTWNNYYQQVQGATQHNIDASGPAVYHPQQQPPSNQ